MDAAEFEVRDRGIAIAWFVIEDDAWDFIGSQRFQDRYEVRPVS